MIGSCVLVVPRSEAGAWTCGATTYVNDPLTEVVQNGGFESDTTGWWTLAPTALPTISTAIHHSGAKSAHVLDAGNPGNVDAAQYDTTASVYVLSSWFYVATWGTGGHFAVALLTNWNPSTGVTDTVTSAYWVGGTLGWTVWVPRGGGSGVSRTYARTLTVGAWHSLETVIDGDIGRQCLYIDGVLVDSATVAPASTFLPQAIVFGDLSWFGDPGEGYYDDLSIQSLSAASPDYVPASASPAGAFPTGESRPTTLSIRVRNEMGVDATVASTLAFYNETTPASPFATFSVPPLPGGASAGPFTAAWVSPGLPGTYRVIAEVDYGGTVQELNETNNRYTWTATVYPPPVTILVVGSPSYDVYITSATPLSFNVQDRSGTGIQGTEYRIDAGPWWSFAGPFTVAGEGSHLIEWHSVDGVGNVEATQGRPLTVDNTPPATTIAIPDRPLSIESRFSLSATDGGSGLDRIEYRVDGGAWQPYERPFALPIGAHAIGYRATDRLGNTEQEHVAPVVVENWKPIIALVFAIVLVVLAAVLAIRARRDDGGRWKPILVGGVIFAVAELATGVISALTGAIPIPPFLGLGTIIDASLIAAGFVVVSLLFVRARPRAAEKPE